MASRDPARYRPGRNHRETSPMRALAAALLLAATPVAGQDVGPAEPFTVAVPDAAIADLEARIRATRWPDQIPQTGWAYGADTAYMKELADYWVDGFDWRAQEARINAFNNFTAEIDGTTIHFIHERGAGPDAIPVLLLHGWPSTIVQFLDIIPLLTDPEAHGAPAGTQSFDVIAASLPGYGFSEIPDEPGFAINAIADRMDALMTDVLGYERYGVRGSDIGKSVAQRLSIAHTENILGLHLTGALRGPTTYPPEPYSDAVETFRRETAAWDGQELAYARMHVSKPQTIGTALNDSPVGLAAWIVEKFHSWADTATEDGRAIESRFSKDELLTNVTVYWVTETINPSMRLYYEFAREGLPNGVGDVPVGYLNALNDQVAVPRELIELNFAPVRYTETDSGGHFLEWEEPELVAEDMRAFFGGLE